ncbi:MAG: FG-GAP repeat protein [Deltaproteobacteria bacterium]|nr:FG-GAP repeat protein [Deltaproteobacteria bacterium]
MNTFNLFKYFHFFKKNQKFSLIIPALMISLAAQAELRQVDFNGDGYADAAIGSPLKDIKKKNQMSFVTNAGQVTILYGTPEGLSGSGSATNILNRSVEDVQGSLETSQEFGAALATGDFDGNGLTDLAVGIPGDKNHRGSVQIFYSDLACDGVCHDFSHIIHSDIDTMLGKAETGERLGSSISAGDFNNDGIDDLAMGIPGYSLNDKPQAGALLVMYGSHSGLNPYETKATELIHLDLAHAVLGKTNAAQENEHYGEGPMVSGDFNCDSYEDLAIGIPSHSASKNAFQSGAVHVLYGSREGLTPRAEQPGHLWEQSIFINEKPEAEDRFGAALLAGHFLNLHSSNQQSCVDLAIGVPGESDYEGVEVIGGIGEPSQEIPVQMRHHGMVQILQGSFQGLVAMNYQNILPPKPYHNMFFGESLSMGYFNDDNQLDLAVGSPGYGVETGEGAVYLFFAKNQRISSSDYGSYSQASNYIVGDPEGIGTEENGGDHFASTLGSGDFDGNGQDEVLVGVPNESYHSTFELGMLHEIHLSQDWLPITTNKTRTWTEEKCNAAFCQEILSPSGANAYDRFGSVLSQARP